MGPILELPPELLINILLRLERADRKNFRRTSRACEEFITPLVFDEVTFDLEPDGCHDISSIAGSPSLCQHVHTIRLERRSGLKNFKSFDEWHDANIHEYVPWSDGDEYKRVLDSSYAMSCEVWRALGVDGQRRLYEEYEREKKSAEAYIGRLASATSELLLPDYIQGAQGQHNASDAGRTLRAFIGTVNALSNVRTLAYHPAYEDENHWGRTWRDIEFHPEGLVAYSDFGVDPDFDALQLFIAFRTTLSAPNALCSGELYTRGQAFWGVPHLCRLLDWSARLSQRSYAIHDTIGEALESWTDARGGPLAAMKYTEALTRELTALERGFLRLTRLDCRIDTSWLEGRNKLATVAEALSHLLKEAVKLEQLRLIFREYVAIDDAGTHTYFGSNFRPQLPRPEFLHESVRVSKHILLCSAPDLQHLRRLHLSLITGVSHLLYFFGRLCNLRYLRLDYVALLPGGGRWEIILEWITQHLRLDGIELQALEDILDAQPRLLLFPDAPVWKAEGVDISSYCEYERAIVRYALRKSNSLPLLSPDDFLRQRLPVQSESSSNSLTA